MKTMAEKQYIKHLYENEEKSLRQIAQITNMDFRTVQKYAHQSNWSLDKLPNMNPETYPAMGPYIAVVDEWLEQDQREPRKQRHTIKRVYERLRDEHEYTGSYDSVKRYYNKKKFMLGLSREGYLPLAQPGGHAQIDFGDFKYYDASGTAQEGHELVVSFPNSNAGWMQVFPSENQECLLEGLKRIFEHIGGVPVRVRADNMTTAVAHIVNGAERILTDGFTRFMLHYRFQADFCNPSAGNEKGNVENKVGYKRRNLLVPVPVIEDFEKYNKELFHRCEEDHQREHYKHGKLISELWEEERQCLLTLPEYAYDVFRYESLSVNKYGFVTIDTNKYGLTPELSGKVVQSKIYADKVELYYDRQLLKTYARSYKRNEEVLDWKQYLPVLVKKPGAVEHTRFFCQMPKLWRAHLMNLQGKERKTALMVLSEIVADGNAALCDDALALADECGRMDADSIRQCYYMIAKEERHPAPLELQTAPPLLDYRPDLLAYDHLTGGGAQ